MDENRSGNAWRRRGSKSPSLESLEGRQLMAAALTQVGIKEVSYQGYTELDLSGTNKGDTITINDNGTSAAGNITVTFGNGSSYTTKTGVSVVKLQDGSGADNVTFNLTGNLVAAQSILLNLGAGNDQFTGNIAGAINTTNGLDLEIYGGAGNDSMVVNQSGAELVGAFVPYLEGDAGNDTLAYNGTGMIAAGASISPEFSGGAGNDAIKTTYSGQVLGNFMYNLSADGGAGNDTIAYNIFLDAGSNGSVGTSPTQPATIRGGAGNDTLQFNVESDPTSTAAVNAVAMGDAGKDTVTHTANVVNDKSNEKDSTVA